MLIEARFRSRALVGENIPALNAIFLRDLSTIKGLWLQEKSVDSAYFDAGTGESAATDLSPCLVAGIKGAISWASRLPAAIEDKAVSDDSLKLILDTEKLDLRRFIDHEFTEIVSAFGAYRATIVTDLELALDDFEEIMKEAQCTGIDVNGRDSVYRINTVNYFDEQLCVRAFGIGSDDLIKKLAGTVEKAEKFAGGLLLITSIKPLVGDELEAIDKRVRDSLR